MMEERKRRKRRGRPALPPQERRTCSVDIDLSPVELAELMHRAAEEGELLRRYIRNAALNRRPRPGHKPPSPELIALAEALAQLAQDLRAMREALAAGRLLNAPRALIERMHTLANAAGLRLLGIEPDAP
jgi:type VI protein secretion system component VasF